MRKNKIMNLFLLTLQNRHIKRCVEKKRWLPLGENDQFEMFFELYFTTRQVKEIFIYETSINDIFYFTVDTSCFLLSETQENVYYHTIAYISDSLGGYYCYDNEDFIYDESYENLNIDSIYINEKSEIFEKFSENNLLKFHYSNIMKLRFDIKDLKLNDISYSEECKNE
jgi:predicted MPP superfamily phosphohydrolase